MYAIHIYSRYAHLHYYFIRRCKTSRVMDDDSLTTEGDGLSREERFDSMFGSPAKVLEQTDVATQTKKIFEIPKDKDRRLNYVFTSRGVSGAIFFQESEVGAPQVRTLSHLQVSSAGAVSGNMGQSIRAECMQPVSTSIKDLCKGVVTLGSSKLRMDSGLNIIVLQENVSEGIVLKDGTTIPVAIPPLQDSDDVPELVVLPVCMAAPYGPDIQAVDGEAMAVTDISQSLGDMIGSAGPLWFEGMRYLTKNCEGKSLHTKHPELISGATSIVQEHKEVVKHHLRESMAIAVTPLLKNAGEGLELEAQRKRDAAVLWRAFEEECPQEAPERKSTTTEKASNKRKKEGDDTALGTALIALANGAKDKEDRVTDLSTQTVVKAQLMYLAVGTDAKADIGTTANLTLKLPKIESAETLELISKPSNEQAQRHFGQILENSAEATSKFKVSYMDGTTALVNELKKKPTLKLSKGMVKAFGMGKLFDVPSKNWANDQPPLDAGEYFSLFSVLHDGKGDSFGIKDYDEFVRACTAMWLVAENVAPDASETPDWEDLPPTERPPIESHTIMGKIIVQVLTMIESEPSLVAKFKKHAWASTHVAVKLNDIFAHLAKAANGTYSKADMIVRDRPAPTSSQSHIQQAIGGAGMLMGKLNQVVAEGDPSLISVGGAPTAVVQNLLSTANDPQSDPVSSSQPPPKKKSKKTTDKHEKPQRGNQDGAIHVKPGTTIPKSVKHQKVTVDGHTAPVCIFGSSWNKRCSRKGCKFHHLTVQQYGQLSPRDKATVDDDIVGASDGLDHSKALKSVIGNSGGASPGNAQQPQTEEQRGSSGGATQGTKEET
jgi:hypothetical protein